MLKPRLLRTSSFRLTLLYSGLTALSFLALFAAVYVSTEHYMNRQIDGTVAAELAEVQSDALEPRSGGLPAVIKDISTRTDGYYYLLQDRDGHVLAGNLPPIEPRPGLREWPGVAHRHGGAMAGVRGRGALLADGSYLFVGMNTFQLHEMREFVQNAFLLGLVLAVFIALAGGALSSLDTLQRIEAVSRTSRDIVGGDLSRRIPVTARGDEFDDLASSLNLMLDRIQALMDGLRQVSTDIAHDLRTPLTRLRQRVELAQRRGAGADHEAVLDATLRELDGILETFGALLRIAQVEGGARKAGFSRVDLTEVLRTVAEVYQPAVDEAGQQLSCAIPPELAVHGDRELLTQMFANLLENANRHSPAGAALSLRAEAADGRVCVTVADSGPGIPEALRGKVLQRFYRLESSRTTPGNGLGLSLAGAVATLHDSVLELEDNQPGLRVRVRLRLA